MWTHSISLTPWGENDEIIHGVEVPYDAIKMYLIKENNCEAFGLEVSYSIFIYLCGFLYTIRYLFALKFIIHFTLIYILVDYYFLLYKI